MNKVLLVLLVIAILGALGTLGYVISTPTAGEKFTEFYILGTKGEAADYPEELMVGEEGKVVMAIINREQKIMNYLVEVVINGVEKIRIGPIVLEHGDKWEEEVSFVIEMVGENQKVEFQLYREGQPEVYQSLHLWVDVT